MDSMDVMKQRHSVRSYKDTPISADIIGKLNAEIATCNKEGNLHLQLVTDEDQAFSGMMAHYGKFSGVRNYLALVGSNAKGLEQRIGYYGERIVLLAQELGLNSCWVALTFSKRKSKVMINANEKLVCVVSLGYGTTQGVAHTSKPMETLCSSVSPKPDWFARGMEAALLAPTATNQQKFFISYDGTNVQLQSKMGFYTKLDLGIVKYHFELGAGKENVTWK